MSAPDRPVSTRRGPLAPVDHGPRERRGIALSFDDGPGRLTEAVLDVLGEHGAAATFFVLGGRIRGREGVLRRLAAAQHELGSHGRTHQPLARRPVLALRELALTSGALRRATGAAPRLFRAPYGSVSPGVVAAARLLGMTTVGWDLDPRDYEAPGTDAIVGSIMRGARPGSIILLHDERRAGPETVAATARVVPALQSQGYDLVTVSELLGGS